MKARGRVNVLGLLTMAALAGLWEASVRLRLLQYGYLPAPSAVARAGWALLVSGELGRDVRHTLAATLSGWVAAAGIGVGLGVLLGLSDRAWRYSMATVEVMRAIPPISLVPVALLIFGFSLRMEFVIIGFVGVWPVLINTVAGVRGVAPELLDVARMLRFSGAATIVKIVLPAAMPSVLVGLRLALSLSLVLAIVAEMIGNPSGLGNAVVRAQQALQPAEMFAFVFTIGFLGVALNACFRSVVSRAGPAARASEHRA